MIQLQKAISAIGVFSMLDAMLQDELRCADGFRGADEILDSEGKANLKQRFLDLRMAINALKHGRGRSYDALVERAKELPFTVKLPDEHFFSEGDVSEVATLVEVDDSFVQCCAETIREITAAIRESHRNSRLLLQHVDAR